MSAEGGEVITFPQAAQAAPQTPSYADLARQLKTTRVIWLALGERAYQWATLLIVSGLFAYAAILPTWPRLVTVVLFTLLVHLPTWLPRRAKEK